MPEISSNKEIVQHIIGEMASSATALDSEYNLSVDNITRLSGNEKAHEIVDEEKKIIGSFVEAFRKDINNIDKIVNEFETIDKELQQKLSKTKS